LGWRWVIWGPHEAVAGIVSGIGRSAPPGLFARRRPSWTGGNVVDKDWVDRSLPPRRDGRPDRRIPAPERRRKEKRPCASPCPRTSGSCSTARTSHISPP